MPLQQHPFAGSPVLVDRVEARAILGVKASAFEVLCREGRFEEMTILGGDALYRSAELRAFAAPARGNAVLINRAGALHILGVTKSTFARFCRERRFEDVEKRGLYRSAELLAYRAAHPRDGTPGAKTVTTARTQAEKPTISMPAGKPFFSKFAPRKRKLVPPAKDTSRAETPSFEASP
jgi:hypothetical protein